MFTGDYRNNLREELIATARADNRITGAAVTGSAARGNEDPWSDIDLAFGVGESEQMHEVMADWTGLMYRAHEAMHHFDAVVGPSIYRVFLLANTLQVDLAFSTAAQFGATGPSFRLLFGTAAPRSQDVPPSFEYLLGWGWIYARHARSCIRRGKLLQAEYVISGTRDQVLALACRRFNLPAAQGRGMDRLPAEVRKPMEAALVRALQPEELNRALRLVVEGLLKEAGHVDAVLAERLEGPLRELTE